MSTSDITKEPYKIVKITFGITVMQMNVVSNKHWPYLLSLDLIFQGIRLLFLNLILIELVSFPCCIKCNTEIHSCRRCYFFSLLSLHEPKYVEVLFDFIMRKVTSQKKARAKKLSWFLHQMPQGYNRKTCRGEELSKNRLKWPQISCVLLTDKVNHSTAHSTSGVGGVLINTVEWW